MGCDWRDFIDLLVVLNLREFDDFRLFGIIQGERKLEPRIDIVDWNER